MVDAIGFTGVSALMSIISYTSVAPTTYFFPSVIYPTVIPFKRGSTKFAWMGASKGLRMLLLHVLKCFSLLLQRSWIHKFSNVIPISVDFPVLLIAHFNIFVNIFDGTFANRFDCVWS